MVRENQSPIKEELRLTRIERALGLEEIRMRSGSHGSKSRKRVMGAREWPSSSREFSPFAHPDPSLIQSGIERRQAYA